VFHYVENHNFYVEHWGHSVFWRKMRQLSTVFCKEGFWTDVDDIFYLRREEIPDALWDMAGSWANGVDARGPHYWPREIARRKGIVEALRAWSPPPALGEPPEVVTEPFTIMLWGITSESIGKWLGGGSESGGISGFAASPGVAEGVARVLTSADQIAEIQDGEILVAQLTSPSWAPVFRRLAGTVTDSGGMMSHAAIVCREYGLPAVTGTAFATQRITTGMRVRVDGNKGTVDIL
jgi:pyruvate,water dikinase